ncbi:MAG: hypothetical protein KH118_01525 [Veillonella sp.]|uniref:hypothetical protein n=1 Tax=Veillonella sp. TaxID=1926307 RepID=UPI00258093FB|nr:hypothetical protein [Veillonella sp.]MBS7010309.1 hypothetical protein [Veillonella sp.]
MEVDIKDLSSKDYQKRQRSIELFLLQNREIKEEVWKNLVKYNIEFFTSIIKISSQMGWRSIHRLLLEINKLVEDKVLFFNDDVELEVKIKNSADFSYFINSLLKYIFRNQNMYYLQYFFREQTRSHKKLHSFWYQLIYLSNKKSKISDKNFIKLRNCIQSYESSIQPNTNMKKKFAVIEELYDLHQKVLTEGRRNINLTDYKFNCIFLTEKLVLGTKAYEEVNYSAIIDYIFYQLGKSGVKKHIEHFEKLLIDICGNNESWKEKYLDNIINRWFGQVNAPWEENELFPFLASANLRLNNDHFDKIKKFLARNLKGELADANFRKKDYEAWQCTKSYHGLYCLAYYQNKLFLEYLNEILLELSTRRNCDIILRERDYNSLYSLLGLYFRVNNNREVINWLKRDIGTLWEQLVFRILSKKYDNIDYQVDLNEYSIADITINKYQDRQYFEKIVECKKSLYFIPENLIDDGIFDYTKHSIIVSKYIGFTDEFIFLILDEGFIEFKCPDNIKIIYARDWLSADYICDQDKHEIDLLMRYSIYLEEVLWDKKLPRWNHEIIRDYIKSISNVEGNNIIDCLELLKDCVKFDKRSIYNRPYNILTFDDFKEQEGV